MQQEVLKAREEARIAQEKVSLVKSFEETLTSMISLLASSIKHTL